MDKERDLEAQRLFRKALKIRCEARKGAVEAREIYSLELPPTPLSGIIKRTALCARTMSIVSLDRIDNILKTLRRRYPPNRNLK